MKGFLRVFMAKGGEGVRVHRCDLVLGEEPWERLEEGTVHGSANWDGLPPLPAAVAIRGAHSRRFPRRSLQVTFTGAPLPDEPPEGHTVRRVHLNADYIDPSRIRSVLSFALFDAMHVPAPRSEYAAVLVNGRGLGLYVVLESVDANFCRRRGWNPGPIYYAVNRNANFGLVSPFTKRLKDPLEAGYYPVERADAAPIRSMLTDLNLASDRAFPRLARQWMDLDAYLHWLMVAVFVGNRDGFVHNYALYLDPERRRFRLIPWDYDATFGIDINGKPARLDRVPVTGWNKLTYRLLSHSRFRVAYRDGFLKALQAGPLSPGSVDNLIDRIRASFASAIDNLRLDRSAIDAGIAGVRTWSMERRRLLVEQLQSL